MFTRQLQKTYLNRKKIKRYGHSIKINPFYVYKCKQCNSWHYSGIGDGKSEKVSIK